MTIIIDGTTGVPVSPVTGTLAVANGGTGLTSIAHTVQVFTSGSGTYTPNVGELQEALIATLNVWSNVDLPTTFPV